MAFRFSLQSVLRLRRSQEDQEEKKLMAIAAAIVRVQEEIRLLDLAAESQWNLQAETMSRAGLCGAELRFQSVSQEGFSAARRVMIAKLARLSLEKAKQALTYKKAREKREILESLRERQKTDYDREFEKLEQQSMDEVFLMRRTREEQE